MWVAWVGEPVPAQGAHRLGSHRSAGRGQEGRARHDPGAPRLGPQRGGARSPYGHVSHAGNKRLKRAMFPSAFASIRTDQVSRAYYEHKRAQGKRHNQALLALAHRRVLTLHATLTDSTLYNPQPAPKLATAA